MNGSSGNTPRTLHDPLYRLNPRVFVGYDQNEALAFSVFSHSIQRLSSLPILISPVMRSQLAGIYSRELGPKESTDFAITRFLVPAICAYEGWAIFADGDMLCRGDILDLWKMRDERYAVQVVKHNHEPRESNKFLGHLQLAYPKKNWSSVMLMNCAKCKSLTPAYVNEAHGLALHQFEWLDGHEIGEIPKEWNHLVGYDPPNPWAKITHFTLGMPFFYGYNECEYAKEWREEKNRMMSYNNALMVA